MAEQQIWDASTGITELGAGWEGLAASEIPGIKAVWESERKRLHGSEQLHDFTEKLSRRWAIETGIIENLYDIDRGVTQTLIEHGFRSELLRHGSTNKPRDYVINLLNDQKGALDGIFDFVKSDRGLTTSYIKELHAALLRSQDTTDAIDSLNRQVEVGLIKGDWKTQPNSPVRDGVTYTYCPPEQVDSEMDRLIDIHNQNVGNNMPCEVQAAWLHHRFTQIHPFQDGNGRVARAITSLILIKNGLFPLVVERDNRATYIDALEAADGGDLGPLIRLFVVLQIAALKQATAISGEVLGSADVDAAIEGLQRAADRVAAEKRAELEGVFAYAGELEKIMRRRLEEIKPDIQGAFQKVSAGAWVNVEKSTAETDHYFRAQIIRNAKEHIGYFANTGDYRAWVALKFNIKKGLRGQLVFAFHGLGKFFGGAMICAPFLEFKDRDEEDGSTQSTFVPLAGQGFTFFYNEKLEDVQARFTPWREDALKVAIAELTAVL